MHSLRASSDGSSANWFRSLSPGPLIALSVALQIALGALLGHVYDTRIFMATGYLVGNGMDPYAPRDLSAVFADSGFVGITTIGYPPAWPLVLGAAYRLSYHLVPDPRLYLLAIKLPLILANIALACLTAGVARQLGGSPQAQHRALTFILFNPFLLYASAAWGQFDSIVALLALLALTALADGRHDRSALLLALALAFKPTALPLIPAALIHLRGRPPLLSLRYMAVLVVSAAVFFVAPFPLLGWDPSPILQNWNFHFTVGGGMSFMTFLELIDYPSTRLPGWWWLVGLLWIPAVILTALSRRVGSRGLLQLLKNAAALIMVFFLTRTWLSEPNVILVLPPAVILTCVGALDRRSLTALWVLPLVFGSFNVSALQLLYPSLPGVMAGWLRLSDSLHVPRLIMRTVSVVPWMLAAAWVIRQCLRGGRTGAGGPHEGDEMAAMP